MNYVHKFVNLIITGAVTCLDDDPEDLFCFNFFIVYQESILPKKNIKKVLIPFFPIISLFIVLTYITLFSRFYYLLNHYCSKLEYCKTTLFYHGNCYNQ